MSSEDPLGIGPSPIGPNGPLDLGKTSGPDSAGNGAEFRRLLEKLEGVARPEEAGSTESVRDLESLRHALDKADDEFASVMELRRRLEDAYRNRLG